MSTYELTEKIRELRQLQALIDEAQAEAEALKDIIKAQMGDCEELRAGEYKVTWKPVESTKFDSKALRLAMPEIYSAFARKSTTRRFCVI